MASRWILGLSISLNALLLAVVFHPVRGSLCEPQIETRQPAPQRFSPLLNRAQSLQLPSVWSEIELGEYEAALRRLRQAGVPEPILRDIVVGGLNRRYGPRLMALRQRPWKFWEPVQRRRPGETAAEVQREQQAHALEAERDRVIERTLGIRWAEVESMVTGRPDRLDRFMEGFPAEPRERARGILARYDAQQREIIDRAGGTVGLPERLELDQRYSDAVEELRTFLSPRELEDYEVRASPAADHLRQTVLVGFAPSEEEFRLIFRARRVLDSRDHAADLGVAPLEGRMPLWKEHYQMEEQLRTLLGDERYAEYRRSQDYTFRGLIELTDQYDLPREIAVQIHDLRETVLARIRALTQDSALNESSRAATLAQLQSETTTKVRAWLGEEAYRRYELHQIGGWMEEISVQ